MSWWMIGLVCLGLSVVLWMLTAVATVWLAMRHGGAFIKWAVLGTLLGPLGLWFAFRHVRSCPQCGGTVLNEVPVCPYCTAPIPRRDPADNPLGPLWSYRKDW